jgi:hypothetical protein
VETAEAADLDLVAPRDGVDHAVEDAFYDDGGFRPDPRGSVCRKDSVAHW